MGKHDSPVKPGRVKCSAICLKGTHLPPASLLNASLQIQSFDMEVQKQTHHNSKLIRYKEYDLNQVIENARLAQTPSVDLPEKTEQHYPDFAIIETGVA